MADLLNKLDEVLRTETLKFESRQKESLLHRANEHYHNLIKRGLLTPRGYTLRGIEDTHLHHIHLNIATK